MTKKLIAIFIISLTAGTDFALAQDGCVPLTPKGGENISEEFKGDIKGEVEGIVAKIAGGSASIEGEYKKIETDTLKDYPDANKVFVWQSIIYLVCVRPEANVDLTKLFALYLSGPPKDQNESINNNGNNNTNIIGSGNNVVNN